MNKNKIRKELVIITILYIVAGVFFGIQIAEPLLSIFGHSLNIKLVFDFISIPGLIIAIFAGRRINNLIKELQNK